MDRLVDVRVQNVKISCNSVSHELARVANSLAIDDQGILQNPPSILTPLKRNIALVSLINEVFLIGNMP
jgi:hypothetical protein